MTITYDIFDTTFGMCLAAETERGICAILFADSQKELLKDLTSRFPTSELSQKSSKLTKAVQAYMKKPSTKADFPLDLHGTPFQQRVWKKLASIPSGKTKTYREIAASLGDANLTRAVGSAIGKNPIGLVIPCHRVLRTDGGLGGYHWGLPRKRLMLSHEGVSVTART